MPYGLVSSGRRSPITPKPCASSTYRSAPCVRAMRANAARSGVLPVMLFTPSMQIERRLAVGLRDQLLEVCGVFEPEPLHRRAVTARNLAAVVQRLVGARVEEDRPAACQHRHDRRVNVRDRGQQQRVLASEQRSEPFLDLLVQHGAPQHPGPARMGTPGLESRRDRGDDVRLEVEAEVVARREISEPMVAHADHAAVDLVDHGVHHRIRRAQIRETLTRLEPAFEPGAPHSVHAPMIGTLGPSL